MRTSAASASTVAAANSSECIVSRLGGRTPVEGAAHDVHVHAARAESEQRDRDREEREVVIHRDREDARERQLDHQDRAGDRADAGERAHEAAAREFVFGVRARRSVDIADEV